MKRYWAEITKNGMMKMVIAGVALVAATATATYLVTDRANSRPAAQAVGMAPGAFQTPVASLDPAQGQSEALYTYHPQHGFVPVSQPDRSGNFAASGEGMNPVQGQPGVLYAYHPVHGFVPVSRYDGNSAPGATAQQGETARPERIHQASTGRSSGANQASGPLSGLSKTTKGALIGGVLGASGGALMGGRGKHKTANGALVGGAIGAVTGGIVGNAMEKK